MMKIKDLTMPRLKEFAFNDHKCDIRPLQVCTYCLQCVWAKNTREVSSVCKKRGSGTSLDMNEAKLFLKQKCEKLNNYKPPKTHF